ncbi:MAG: GAF domain-containing SpoIIE family protein phosphatase [Planctomycetota bacterium]
MISPATPTNEAERLAELRALQLLDTPPEERFDRIVRLASRMFDLPIAYVALVDADRQWFKATCGLETTSTERSISFCGHTILQRTPLVIADTLDDARFFDSPLVTEQPGVRFYAGHPLRGPGGHNVGTLCVADHVPRPAASVPLDSFGDLAGIAEHELGMLDVIEAQRELLDAKRQLLVATRRLEHEIRNAADYIQSLLPEDIERPCLRITSRFEPSSELGGDFIGCVPLDEARVAVFLLDVAGHGVAASLLAVSIGQAIREHLGDPDLAADPGALMSRVNASFPMERHGNRFATAWLGIVDEVEATVRYACGGHHPALVIGQHGTRHLAASDLPLGVLDGTEYETAQASLAPGDRLYLFSDGVFEVELPGGSQMGLGSFEALAERTVRGGGRIGDLIEAVRSRGGSEDFADDVTVIEVALR